MIDRPWLKLSPGCSAFVPSGYLQAAPCLALACSSRRRQYLKIEAASLLGRERRPAEERGRAARTAGCHIRATSSALTSLPRPSPRPLHTELVSRPGSPLALLTALATSLRTPSGISAQDVVAAEGRRPREQRSRPQRTPPSADGRPHGVLQERRFRKPPGPDPDRKARTLFGCPGSILVECGFADQFQTSSAS